MDTEETRHPADEAISTPTKDFFVEMLTRDISLEDAILDLIDNCLDGALRVDGPKPNYAKFWARIKIAPDEFSIVDNCGGIDRETARRTAFRLGRDLTDSRDNTLNTIGMYGIGMKRAIFKMGFDAQVTCRTDVDTFGVHFTESWMKAPTWDPIRIDDRDEESLPEGPGTKIVVRSLRRGVSELFQAPDFVDRLQRSISEHFTLFLEQGFAIQVNAAPIRPARIEVLVPAQPACTPFFVEDLIGATKVTVIVGINPRVLTGAGDEEDSPEERRDSSMPEAGWNVFCNDRAVLVADKSRLTGWGVAFASFHPQFAVITGMVHFEANNADDLPVTTTKRALDASSEVWLIAWKLMTKGMKSFMSYTTAWKNAGREAQQQFFYGAARLGLHQAATQLSERASPVPHHQKHPNRRIFDPQKEGLLPKPKGRQFGLRRIVFSRPKTDIDFLAHGAFSGLDTPKPGDVGAACFDRVLNEERGDV